MVRAVSWRRDVVENAQLLASSIREIQANSGDPATKVDLVAHSMGGLIVEYYLLYGDEDVLDREPLPAPTYAGAANVRRVVLLGVPHLGCCHISRWGVWRVRDGRCGVPRDLG